MIFERAKSEQFFREIPNFSRPKVILAWKFQKISLIIFVLQVYIRNIQSYWFDNHIYRIVIYLDWIGAWKGGKFGLL